MFSFFKRNKPDAAPQIDLNDTLDTPKPDHADTVLDATQSIAQTHTPAPAAPVIEDAKPTEKTPWFARLKNGLSKTRALLSKHFIGLFTGRQIDEDLYEELETALLTADVGVDATQHLLKGIRDRVEKQQLSDGIALKNALKAELHALLKPLEVPLVLGEHQPFVIMLAGVNGAGKTTSIGKLAKHFQAQGKTVLLAAGDTFRAAAREQLEAWGSRNGVTVIAQDKGDAAAVIFDAIQAAKARKIDIVLADTAGRLPTQLHLMDELKKIKRVIQKAEGSAPHEVLVVLDGNTGQNAIAQVKAFDDAIGVTGLIISKLDGSAKGGMIAAVAKQRPIPVRFIGVGEQIEDLQVFDAHAFVDALFEG